MAPPEKFLDTEYNKSYTLVIMKTAISIPDTVFKSAEQAAHRLGHSRSQLYTTALKDYLSKIENLQVTKQLDDVYGAIPAEFDTSLHKLQTHSLPKEKW